MTFTNLSSHFPSTSLHFPPTRPPFLHLFSSLLIPPPHFLNFHSCPPHSPLSPYPLLPSSLSFNSPSPSATTPLPHNSHTTLSLLLFFHLCPPIPLPHPQFLFLHLILFHHIFFHRLIYPLRSPSSFARWCTLRPLSCTI